MSQFSVDLNRFLVARGVGMPTSSYQYGACYCPGSIGESRSWPWNDPRICAIPSRKEIVSRINGNYRSEVTTGCNPTPPTNDFIILRKVLGRWDKVGKYTHSTGAPTWLNFFNLSASFNNCTWVRELTSTSDALCTTSSSLLSGFVATLDGSTLFAGPLEGNSACILLELGCWAKGVNEVFNNFCVGEGRRIDCWDRLLTVERWSGSRISNQENYVYYGLNGNGNRSWLTLWN